jgi:hypothetical protein
VHIKVKQFRLHKNFELSQKLLCCNCDQVFATFRCLQCDTPDNCFCTDCSEVHTQVKAYRYHTFDPMSSHNHAITPLNGRSQNPAVNRPTTKQNKRVEPLEISVSEDPASSTMDRCYSFFLHAVDFLNINISGSSKGDMPGDKCFDWVVESLGDITSSGDMDAKTVLFGFSVAFLIHLLVKLLLGKNSIFVIIAVGMFGVRWLRRKQDVTVTAINALKSVCVFVSWLRWRALRLD